MRPLGNRSDFVPWFYLGISVAGLFCLAALAFWIRPPATDYTWQRPLAYSVFIVICLLGGVAAISPSRCSTCFGPRERGRGPESRPSSNIKPVRRATARVGHHPDCGEFSSHVLRFGSRSYCAGCTGLFAGAALSILGILGSILIGPPVGDTASVVFLIGCTGVLAGLFQNALFRISSSYARVIVNMFFVFGAFFVLIGTDVVANNLTLDALFMALVPCWIMTRMGFSRIEHARVCRACGLDSCALFQM